MGCPAVTTSCCVLAWPLKVHLSRCHPRRSATVKARGGGGASSEHLVGRPQALHILPIEARTLADKHAALVLIGRYLGMFDAKVKVDAVYGISEEPMSAEEWNKQFAKAG